MKLIIALGNPGKQYEKNRHNAGFLVLDEIAKILSFEQFSFDKKFNAEICQGTLGTEKTILAKPQTFMNLSGVAVSAIMNFFKIPLENLIIIHDDLDIELGKYKISNDSSAAGHNGVISIFENLGTQKIKRIRLGIEGAEKKLERQMAGKDFVLQDFSDQEIETVKDLAQKITQEL